jgi:hypothetical protein
VAKKSAYLTPVVNPLVVKVFVVDVAVNDVVAELPAPADVESICTEYLTPDFRFEQVYVTEEPSYELTETLGTGAVVNVCAPSQEPFAYTFTV